MSEGFAQARGLKPGARLNVLMNGKQRTPVEKLGAGDIAAAVKLKDTHTGNTLCDLRHPVKLPKVEYPVPYTQAALKLNAPGDEVDNRSVDECARFDPATGVTSTLATGLNPAILSRATRDSFAKLDPRTLIRRVYFDLIGLPPTAEEVTAFEKAAAHDVDLGEVFGVALLGNPDLVLAGRQVALEGGAVVDADRLVVDVDVGAGRVGRDVDPAEVVLLGQHDLQHQQLRRVRRDPAATDRAVAEDADRVAEGTDRDDVLEGVEVEALLGDDVERADLHEAEHRIDRDRKLAKPLGIEHHILTWTGRKPSRGLQEAARDGQNVVPAMLDAARAYATLYEIRHAMEAVFGAYQEPVFF